MADKKKKPRAGAESALNPPTKIQLNEITKLVGEGYTQVSIAAHFKIGGDTWNKRKKAFPKIQVAVDAGKYSGEKLVLGKFWKLIKNENHKSHATAVIFYLKAQCGWTDKTIIAHIEETRKKSKINIKKVKVNG